MASHGLRRSPRKPKNKDAKQKQGKKEEPPLPAIKWQADDGALIWSLIAQMEVKENRLVLFGKQDSHEVRKRC
jgi:hypothetical protein